VNLFGPIRQFFFHVQLATRDEILSICFHTAFLPSSDYMHSVADVETPSIDGLARSTGGRPVSSPESFATLHGHKVRYFVDRISDGNFFSAAAFRSASSRCLPRSLRRFSIVPVTFGSSKPVTSKIAGWLCVLFFGKKLTSPVGILSGVGIFPPCCSRTITLLPFPGTDVITVVADCPLRRQTALSAKTRDPSSPGKGNTVALLKTRRGLAPRRAGVPVPFSEVGFSTEPNKVLTLRIAVYICSVLAAFRGQRGAHRKRCRRKAQSKSEKLFARVGHFGSP
jgi:hypothetical protein